MAREALRQIVTDLWLGRLGRVLNLASLRRSCPKLLGISYDLLRGVYSLLLGENRCRGPGNWPPAEVVEEQGSKTEDQAQQEVG